MTVTASQDPIAEFKAWLAEAEASEPVNPTAAALAYGLHAATVSGRETAELLSSSETDWEILALGPEASSGDLPKVVERLVGVQSKERYEQSLRQVAA